MYAFLNVQHLPSNSSYVYRITFVNYVLHKNKMCKISEMLENYNERNTIICEARNELEITKDINFSIYYIRTLKWKQKR